MSARSDRLAASVVAPSARHHELDWLRALAVVAVIVGHAAALYTGINAFSFNAESSAPLRAFARESSYWRMPVLFFVAGASCALALGTRPVRAYLRERTARLAIPLVFALATYLPATTWLARQTVERIALTRDVPAVVADAHAATWNGWGHLWFVAYLIPMTALAVPLLARLRDGALRRALDRVPAAAWSPIGAATVLSTLLLRHAWTERWPYPALVHPKTFVASLALFLLGTLYGTVPAFRAALVRDRWRSLAAWGALLAAGLLAPAAPAAGSAAAYAAYAATMLKTWCWVAAMVGFAQRHLARPSPLLATFAGVSYPMYLLHMPIVVLLGAHVTPLAWPVAVEFPVVCALTLLLTYVLAKGVQATPTGSLLFGLRQPSAARPTVGEVLRTTAIGAAGNGAVPRRVHAE